jgi:organic radical activating enzyme
MKVELPHLDVMCLTACNLKCVGCTNLMGAVAMEIWAAAEIEHDVAAAAEVMHAEVACLLGGEPTAHPDLVRLMRFTAGSGLAERVQVLTNGMRLHRMSDEFWTELDWLKISIYPGRTPPENVDLATTRQREHGFELTFYDVASDPFRAVLTDRERSPQSTQAVYDGCWYRTFTRKLERGYFYRCCTSPSISQTILGLGPDADGITLDGLTPEALTAFLDRREPARSCARCHGHLGPRLPEWSEERGREAWLHASTVPAGS